MKILVIDNYDSFVYNIVGLLQRCRTDIPDLEWIVVKNDEPIPGIPEDFDALILSPGPGIPTEAGNLMDIIRIYADTHPILGICLGFQAIAEVYGWHLRQLAAPRHGHASHLREIDPSDPLIGFLASAEQSDPDHNDTTIGRYHSWVIDPIGGDEDSAENRKTGSPSQSPLRITSVDEDRNIMTIRHISRPIFGLQFHPESIITTQGHQILRNFLAQTVAATR